MKKMYRKISSVLSFNLVLSLLFLTALVSKLNAQQQAALYGFTETTEVYTPVSGTNSTATGDDASQNTISIGFTFLFEGVSYTTFSINTNGFIRLGNTIAASPWTNTLGNTAAQRPLLAPFWDDNHRGTGSIQYATSGSAPNRVLEVGWDNINIGGSGSTSATMFASYKLRIHETTGTIEFIYGPTMDAAGALSASVGINGTGSFLSVSPSAASTVSSTTADNNISSTVDIVGKKFVFLMPPPPSCPTPSVLTATSITSSAANLGWTENGSATTWNVEWGVTGFTQGTGTLVTGTSNNPEPISGLSPSTTYQFYVQADCGGSGTSSWAGPFAFTTACSVYNSFPFLETFESASPSRSCWSQIQETGAGAWTYNTGAGGGSITTAQSGTLNARFVSTSGVNSPITKLVSPTFDLTALSTPELSFYYGQEDWAGDQNELKIYYRISATDPWVEIAYYTSNVASWTQQTLVLPNASATYQIAFEGINNYGRANVVDEVEIKEAPACPAPSVLTANSITSSSANLGWTENGSATTWNVEWGATGFTQGTGTMITGTTNNPEPIIGLAPETTYDFYVQADCGGSGTSAWVGPFSFTTACAAPVISTFPWTENFDGVLAPAMPCGWIVDNANADTYTWVTGSNFANSAPNSMQIRWNATEAANDWSFTPELVLVGGQTYELSFAFAVAGATFPEKLKVMYGSAQNAAGMTDLLLDSTLTNTVFDTAFATFTPATSGSYYIGFHNYSDANMFRVYVDDVTVKEIMSDSCSIPSNLTAFNISPSSAMLDWTENGTATEWDIEWGFQGFTLGTGTPEHVTAKPYQLNGLMPNTAYSYYVRADCGNGDTSLWVGPYNFMTPPCMPIGLDLGNDTTLCSDQSLTLNAPTAGAYGWSWSTTESTPSITIDTASLGGNGTYTISVSMIDFSTMCMYNDAIDVTFSVCSGVKENAAIGFEVYPNPTNGIFTVKSIEKGTVEVTNLQGKVVYKNTLNSNTQLIDLSANAKGVYFVAITTTNGVEVQKMVIQ